MYTKEYLESKEWEIKKNLCKKYYDYMCCMCGSKEELQIHHKNYNNLGNEQNGIDIICVCKKCHEKLEEEKKVKYRVFYKNEFIGELTAKTEN